MCCFVKINLPLDAFFAHNYVIWKFAPDALFSQVRNNVGIFFFPGPRTAEILPDAQIIPVDNSVI